MAEIKDDSLKADFQKVIERADERFSKASDKAFEIIENYLVSGYVKDFARLLVFLNESRRQKMLEQMPPAVKEKVLEVLPEYSVKDRWDAHILTSVGYVMKEAGFFGKACADEVISGEDAVFKTVMDQRFSKYFRENPLLALNIEGYLINFEIVISLDDRAVQKVLREVDTECLAKALKGADPDIQDKIFRNMSRRAAAMLREDMEFMGLVYRSDVYAAQKFIIDIIMRLCENEEIVIPNITVPLREADDELVI